YVVELALYNAVLSGVGLDGTNFFYVNPLRSIQPQPLERRWKHQRVPFMSSFCCPPNLARTIAEVAGYAYATSSSSSLSPSDAERGGAMSDTIWVNLYGANTLETKLAGGQSVKLTQETDYPWNGKIRLAVNDCRSTAFALKIRIPGWAQRASVRVNHKPAGPIAKPAHYLELRRVWRPGDVVDLDFPMPPRLLEANPLVEETLNQIAIQRGPLV